MKLTHLIYVSGIISFARGNPQVDFSSIVSAVISAAGTGATNAHSISSELASFISSLANEESTAAGSEASSLSSEFASITSNEPGLVSSIESVLSTLSTTATVSNSHTTATITKTGATAAATSTSTAAAARATCAGLMLSGVGVSGVLAIIAALWSYLAFVGILSGLGGYFCKTDFSYGCLGRKGVAKISIRTHLHISWTTVHHS